MNINLISKYKKNVILIKFFIGLLGVSAISVILLAIGMYSWFQEKSMVEIDNANRLALSNIDTVVSGYLDTARRISMELYQSSDIKSLILNDGEEWNDNIQKAGDRILSTMTVNTYITSVYVFSKSRILLKPTNKVMPEKYENGFMEMIKNNPVEQPLPWVLEPPAGYKTNIVSLFFREGMSGDNDFVGAVLINLNMDMLHKIIFANQLNKQQLYIIDKKGRILLQNDMEDFGRDISSEVYFKEITASGNDHGSLKLRISGKDYYLSYLMSQSKDFYTVSLMEYGLSIMELTKMKNIVIAACVLILLCISAASLVISYRIYKPIGNVFMNIRNLFSNTAQNQAGMNEIQLATQTIAGIVERMNSYEKEKERNTIRSFFQTGGSPDEEEIRNIMRILRVSEKLEINYYIAVLRLNGYKDFVRNNSVQAIDFQLNSIGTIAFELIGGKAACCYCDCGVFDDHILLFIGDASNSPVLRNTELIKLLAGVQEAVDRMLGLEVTVGLSEMSGDMGCIRDKYREAYGLTNYRLLYGRNSIIDATAVSTYNNDEVSHEYMDRILEAVMKNSRKAFEDSIDKLILVCRNQKINYKTITETFSNIIASMLKIPAETGISNKNREMLNAYDLFKQVEGMEDLNEFKSLMLELYEKLTNTLSEINNTGVRDVVTKALDFIGNNYNNPDVTANYIAEKLSISPSYFSRIFKECVGTTFPEYITNIRLEKAKEALMNNNPDEIKDICYKVGYSSTSYFIAAFKKKYGITPSKYRLHNISANGNLSNY